LALPASIPLSGGLKVAFVHDGVIAIPGTALVIFGGATENPSIIQERTPAVSVAGRFKIVVGVPPSYVSPQWYDLNQPTFVRP
jgi:hypothetical protein